MNRINNFANRRTSGNGAAYPSFWLPLNDAGAGAVNTTPGIGVGSATFTRATAATTILSSGLIASVGSGVARSTYSPAGIYLGYLAEEARTNLLRFSADLSNGAWVSSAVTVGGSVTLPDGTTGTVNKIMESASTSPHIIAQAVTKAASALTYTVSAWLKASERGFAYLQMSDGTTNAALASWNLATGAIVSAAAVIGNFTAASATAGVAYPNGWWRVTLTATSNTITSIVGAVAPSITGSDSFNYTGVTNSGIFAWGAQLEQAAFATSYIPTTTVAVARNADILTYPTSGNIVTSTGAAAAEFTAATGSGRIVASGATPATALQVASSTTVGLFDGANVDNSNAVASIINGAIHKAASEWNVSTANASLDGGIGVGGSFNGDILASQTTLGIGAQSNGASSINGTIKNLRLWKRALPDAFMRSITS